MRPYRCLNEWTGRKQEEEERHAQDHHHVWGKSRFKQPSHEEEPDPKSNLFPHGPS